MVVYKSFTEPLILSLQAVGKHHNKKARPPGTAHFALVYAFPLAIRLLIYSFTPLSSNSTQ